MCHEEMTGLESFVEKSSNHYKPEEIKMEETVQYVPKLTFQDVQLKDCFWREKSQEWGNQKKASFQYEVVTSPNKAYRIKKFSTEKIEELMVAEGIHKVKDFQLLKKKMPRIYRPPKPPCVYCDNHEINRDKKESQVLPTYGPEPKPKEKEPEKELPFRVPEE